MNASSSRVAPWHTATPQAPALLAASPAFDTPLGAGFPAGALSLRDPFRWKLEASSASSGLTQLLGEATKRAALKACETVCDTMCEENSKVPFGVYVSSVSEVALAAASRAAFLYVPGEVCRQADVLDACVKAGLPVALERGPFLPPSDMVRAFQKLAGLDVLLLDAGGVNGYADRVVDPRALWILKETGAPFGLHLGEALAPQGAQYEWKPRWLEDARFVRPLVLAARALGACAYVFPFEGNASLNVVWEALRETRQETAQ